MKKTCFLKLLDRYLKGEATLEEENFLLSYYNLFEHEPDVAAVLSKEQVIALKEEIKGRIWANIAREEQGIETIVPLKRRYRRLAVASIVIAICVIGLIFRFDLGKWTGQEMTFVRNTQNVDFLVNLPDGSKVILGAGSTLNYPSTFFDKNKKRDVYLFGNAFFDVAHDPKRPFTVYSENIRTRVLGTAFSVEAFPWSSDVTVTVNRGKVRVSDEHRIQGVISPNQQIKYNKIKSHSIKQIVNAKNYSQWKSKTLFFDDVDFQEAAKILEKRFNVKIVFNGGDVKNKRFTAAFDGGKSLEAILKAICDFNEANYSYNKDSGLVTIGSADKLKTINL